MDARHPSTSEAKNPRATDVAHTSLGAYPKTHSIPRGIGWMFPVARATRGTTHHNTIALRRVRILLDDPLLGPLSGIRVTVKYSNNSTEEITADGDGILKVRAGRGTHVDLEFATALRSHRRRVFLVMDSAGTKPGAWRRLVNLGYVRARDPAPELASDDLLARALEQFQADHGLKPTGDLDDRTQSTLESSEQSSSPWGEQKPLLPEDEHAHNYRNRAKDEVT